MNDKVKEKRRPRSYKATDSIYNAAMAVAEDKKTTLAQAIEKFVTSYSKTKGK